MTPVKNSKIYIPAYTETPEGVLFNIFKSEEIVGKIQFIKL